MDRKEIEKILEQLCIENKISDSEKAVLLRNCESLQTQTKEKGIMMNNGEAFMELVRFVLETSTYVFKQAFQNSFFESEEEFYYKRWGSTVTLAIGKTAIDVKISKLYSVCASVAYLDAHLEPNATDFLNNHYTEADLKALIEITGTDDCKVEDAIPEVYDAILSVEDLRRIAQRNCWNEIAERLLENARNFFRQNVFCGVLSYNESINVTDEIVLKKICSVVAEHGFDVHYLTGDMASILIRPEVWHGDYSLELSEQDLKTMMNNSESGGVYYYVSVYCEKVLLPRITKIIVQDVVDALEKITIGQSRVKVIRRTTETLAYEQLFKVLKRKGFAVEEEESSYVIRW